MPIRETSDHDPLDAVLRPPFDETPEEKGFRLAAEEEARRISQAIDESIRQERLQRKKMRVVRLLLLGQSESGKSTTLRQFQRLYTPSAFREERALWHSIIQLNILRSVRIILDALADVRPHELPAPPPLALAPGLAWDTPEAEVAYALIPQPAQGHGRDRAYSHSLAPSHFSGQSVPHPSAGIPPLPLPQNANGNANASVITNVGAPSTRSYPTFASDRDRDSDPDADTSSADTGVGAGTGGSPGKAAKRAGERSGPLSLLPPHLATLRARLAPLRHAEARLIAALVPPDEDAPESPPGVGGYAQGAGAGEYGNGYANGSVDGHAHAYSNGNGNGYGDEHGYGYAYGRAPDPVDYHAHGHAYTHGHMPQHGSEHGHAHARRGSYADTGTGEVFVRPGTGWKRAVRRGLGLGLGLGRGAGGPGLPETGEIVGEVQAVLAGCRVDVLALWGDRTVQTVLKRRKIRLQEGPGFFLDQLERIAQPRYQPSDDDVLKARLKTVGVSEYRFEMEAGSESGTQWRIIDVGGSRSQRQTWVPFFDDVDAIIFLAPISGFDQTLAEDKSVNRLEDSVLLWKALCANKLLARVNLVLFLNKCDILSAKLSSGIRLAKYVRSYGERSNDSETAEKYFRSKFTAIHREYSPIPRKFYGFCTSVTDTRTTGGIIASVRDMVARENLRASKLL